MGRLVLITAENLGSARISLPVIRDHADELSLVMITPNLPVNTGGNRGRAWRLLRRASLGFVVFKFVEMYVHNLLAWMRRRSIKQTARRCGVPVRKFPSASDSDFLAALREARPDYALNAGPVILGREVIDAPRMAILNCHGARLPEYRGAANYVWMLLNEEETAYPTVQRMVLELDEGDVFAERPVRIDHDWSVYRLNWEVACAAGELYSEFAGRILAEGLPEPIVRPGAVPANRGFPERDAIRELRKKGYRLIRLGDVFSCV